jgi:hypothetical protein
MSGATNQLRAIGPTPTLADLFVGALLFSTPAEVLEVARYVDLEDIDEPGQTVYSSVVALARRTGRGHREATVRHAMSRWSGRNQVGCPTGLRLELARERAHLHRNAVAACRRGSDSVTTARCQATLLRCNWERPPEALD